MGFVATSSGGKDFPIMPSGLHIARCYMMVYLGLQPAWGMEKEPKKKIRIGFEFPEEKYEFVEGKGEEPFTLSHKYTFSIHEKAALRQALQAWRGKPFTEEEAQAFDVSRVIGAAAMVNVVHKQNKEGKTKAYIAGLNPLPKGQKCPPAILQPLVYDVENPDVGVYNVLPKWIQEEIDQTITDTPPQQSVDGGDAPEPASDNEEDDCPF